MRWVKSDKCRESVPCQIGWAFPEDPYVALEEVRKILQLSKNKVSVIFALLRKGCEGFLGFQVGNMIITFTIDSVTEKKIALEIEVRKENMENSVKYWFGGEKHTMEDNGV